MACEVIQLETNCQLRQNSHNLNRKAGPGPRTLLTDKGTRLLTTEVAEDLKKKAEAKFEAELEAKLCLENKQMENARGLAPPSKAGSIWRCVLAKGETDWNFVYISFP